MAKKNEIHVSPNKKEKCWDIIKSGDTIATKKTQKDAISSARVTAKSLKAELVIHGKDGKIRKKDSYGNDPHPPKG
jgi:hypothetical protein